MGSISAQTESIEYKHADGMVGKAESNEEARRICPFLGKSAIEQVNIILDMHAIGTAAMEEKETDQNNPIFEEQTSPAKNADYPVEYSKFSMEKPGMQNDSIGNEDRGEKTVESTHHEISAESVAAVNATGSESGGSFSNEKERGIEANRADEKQHQQVLEQVRESEATFEKSELPPIISREVLEIETVKDVITHQEPTPEIISATPVGPVIIGKDNNQQILKDESLEITAQHNPIVSDIISKGHETKVEVSEYQDIGIQALPSFADNIDESQPFINTALSETEPLVLKEEAIKTYQQILEIIETPLELETVDSTEETIENSFEKYISSRYTPEETATFGMIIANAPEQDLGETFAQLADCLKDNPDDTEPAIVRQLLMEIKEEFSRIYFSADINEQGMIPISPEITEKLLILLRNLGYQNANEVLVEFIERQNIDYLVQVVSYLNRLSKPENRQEFTQTYRASLASHFNTSSKRRVGKSILEILKVKLSMPSLKPVE